MIQDPDLATEVTLQPIKRFGFDGAVLFSDILVIPQALGQGFEFGDAGGIRMDFTLRDQADIERLQVDAVVERLEYVAQALRQLRQALGNRTALLGFAGSPWTLANFMMEGGSAKEFTKARALFYEDATLFNRLMEKLASAVTRFLQLQIDAGADAVQIFDSLGGMLAPEVFEAASARWMRQIIESLDRSSPVIAFSKGTHGSWNVLSELGSQVIGIDWGIRLADARKLIPANIALQGNLDPVLLQTTPAAVTRATRQILDDMRGHPGHIFNLGHGTPPGAKLDCIEALVNTVRNHRPNP